MVVFIIQDLAQSYTNDKLNLTLHSWKVLLYATLHFLPAALPEKS